MLARQPDVTAPRFAADLQQREGQKIAGRVAPGVVGAVAFRGRRPRVYPAAHLRRPSSTVTARQVCGTGRAEMPMRPPIARGQRVQTPACPRAPEHMPIRMRSIAVDPVKCPKFMWVLDETGLNACVIADTIIINREVLDACDSVSLAVVWPIAPSHTAGFCRSQTGARRTSCAASRRAMLGFANRALWLPEGTAFSTSERVAVRAGVGGRRSPRQQRPRSVAHGSASRRSPDTTRGAARTRSPQGLSPGRDDANA